MGLAWDGRGSSCSIPSSPTFLPAGDLSQVLNSYLRGMLNQKMFFPIQSRDKS